jgi:hypothetical protein
MLVADSVAGWPASLEDDMDVNQPLINRSIAARTLAPFPCATHPRSYQMYKLVCIQIPLNHY